MYHYHVISSLNDLEVGKNYFQNGNSYFVLDNDGIFLILQGKHGTLTIPLDETSSVAYLNAVRDNCKEALFYELDNA